MLKQSWGAVLLFLLFIFTFALMGMHLFAGKILLPPPRIIIPGSRLYIRDPSPSSSPLLPGLRAIAEVSQQPPQDYRLPDRINVSLVSSFFSVREFTKIEVSLDGGGGSGALPSVRSSVPDLDNFESWISSLRTTTQIVFGNRWNVLLQLTQDSGPLPPPPPTTTTTTTRKKLLALLPSFSSSYCF